MKHIQRLRKMIRMAVDNEWIDRDPFQKFKIRMERKEREFLNLNELQKIQTYHTGIERLRIVKDLFVLSLLSFSTYPMLSIDTQYEIVLIKVHYITIGNARVATKNK